MQVGTVAVGTFMGILTFAQVVLPFPLAVAVVVACVAMGTGLLSLQHFWRENNSDSLLCLYEAFPRSSGDNHLAFVAFKEREHQAEFRAFRTIFDQFMKEETPPTRSTESFHSE